MPFKPLFKTYKRKLLGEVYNFRFGRFERQIEKRTITEAKANEIMSGFLQSSRPFLVGRAGAMECGICWNFARASYFDVNHSKKKLAAALNNAGISSLEDESLDRFSLIYLASIAQLDLIGAWKVAGMYPLLARYGSPNSQYTALGSLEPWSAFRSNARPWTSLLHGKRILVVHPFARSIEAQYANRANIKTIGQILPDFELTTLVPPVTFAGQDNGASWVNNLHGLMSQAAARDFDVALIGCGAYGLPLGAFVKQMGRGAIHLGGALQLLFGIRGKRWDDRADLLPLMDESWIRPLREERPAGADAVEQACYW